MNGWTSTSDRLLKSRSNGPGLSLLDVLESQTVGGERSEKQRMPDLPCLTQELVDQPDWQAGNALVLIISGSGRRNAQSWLGSVTGVPMLYVEH